MNKQIRRIAVAMALLFTALLANANYLQVVRAEELNGRADNRRVVLDEYSTQRGPVLVEGQAVARSVPTEGELEYLREYPAGPLYAHVTGYYSYLFGRAAVERSYNDVLSGNDDRLFVRRVVDLVTGRDVEGGTVALTITAAAQSAAADGLAGKKGAVVALDPTTGAILAMVSSPTYDPNVLSTHDLTAQEQAWETLQADANRPALNRALASTYPPGSVFKIVTAAAALESGRYRRDTQVPGPAAYRLPGTQTDLPNQSGDACGAGDTTTLEDALRISCNTAFAAIANDLGADALRDQAERFGYDSEPLPELNAATSVFPGEIDDAQTALSGIGQFDVRATALQTAMVSAAVANRGVLMRPYLVQEVLAPDLSPIESTRPEEQSQAMSPDNAAALTGMMQTVVDQGTGGNAQIGGIPVAGKTGTAQSSPERPPYAWFTAFAPVDDPRVAVAVVIEDAAVERNDISGGRLAAPIARAVMEAVLGA